MVKNSIAEVEKFVCHCYGLPLINSVNESRFQIFSSSVSGNLRELPPTKKPGTAYNEERLPKWMGLG